MQEHNFNEARHLVKSCSKIIIENYFLKPTPLRNRWSDNYTNELNHEALYLIVAEEIIPQLCTNSNAIKIIE